jgi:hypothetical protein
VWSAGLLMAHSLSGRGAAGEGSST